MAAPRPGLLGIAFACWVVGFAGCSEGGSHGDGKPGGGGGGEATPGTCGCTTNRVSGGEAAAAHKYSREANVFLQSEDGPRRNVRAKEEGKQISPDGQLACKKKHYFRHLLDMFSVF